MCVWFWPTLSAHLLCQKHRYLKQPVELRTQQATCFFKIKRVGSRCFQGVAIRRDDQSRAKSSLPRRRYRWRGKKPIATQTHKHTGMAIRRDDQPQVKSYYRWRGKKPIAKHTHTHKHTHTQTHTCIASRRNKECCIISIDNTARAGVHQQQGGNSLQCVQNCPISSVEMGLNHEVNVPYTFVTKNTLQGYINAHTIHTHTHLPCDAHQSGAAGYHLPRF